MKKLRLLAGDLKEQGKFFESLFIYKVSYDESFARCDGAEMAHCIYDMTNAIRSASMENDGSYVSTQCKGTAEEALKFIDQLHLAAESKWNYKAMCLHGIGTLHCKLGDHDRAISKHDQAIALMDKCSDVVKNTVLYGDCFNDKGVSLIRQRRYKHALRCFRASIDTYKKATDFSCEEEKDDKLKRTKRNLKAAKNLKECVIL